MVKVSAGLLVYRVGTDSRVEVLIAHMGGPYWAGRDEGAWSIPKGEYDPHEAPLSAALREFEEEIGSPPPAGAYEYLGEYSQPHGKIVTTFVIEGDFDLQHFSSNSFELEWPPGSGVVCNFPEMDCAGWFQLEPAERKLVPGQRPIIDSLRVHLIVRGLSLG